MSHFCGGAAQDSIENSYGPPFGTGPTTFQRAQSAAPSGGGGVARLGRNRRRRRVRAMAAFGRRQGLGYWALGGTCTFGCECRAASNRGDGRAGGCRKGRRRRVEAEPLWELDGDNTVVGEGASMGSGQRQTRSASSSRAQGRERRGQANIEVRLRAVQGAHAGAPVAGDRVLNASSSTGRRTFGMEGERRKKGEGASLALLGRGVARLGEAGGAAGRRGRRRPCRARRPRALGERSREGRGSDRI